MLLISPSSSLSPDIIFLTLSGAFKVILSSVVTISDASFVAEAGGARVAFKLFLMAGSFDWL